MKKNSIIIISAFLLLNLLSGCSSSEKKVQLGAFETGANSPAGENNSLFSLTNIQSGFMINSVLDQSGREISAWRMTQQETPVEVLVTSPSGWVQFNDPLTNQCLNALSGRSLAKGSCDGKASLFILIPSTTGAVQIQSVVSGMCIVDKENEAFFKFGKCVADFTQPQLIVPEKNLWMLNPPVTVSTLAPINI
ncbi:hypothetical protein A9798_12395 [Edwardsiella hoshinae]|uniref:Cytolethal distending toxin A/C family n=1 Tax=Edwardsiella hoshinae TaxID=93378 RepID=A0A376DJI3_9GAMM|nr:hypothetical protein [Edwardsiella hoshinae]AOV97669.1 hypothetical protein A9798_12395 [Edwardsiella hoshinae]QPR29429.1 toxin [Edwardsiella hoshinae]STC90518.1 Cytolethal distending toxin A/C family [Edwardsiella hoshinae]